MSRNRLPPPQPQPCLTLSRTSRYKGGTLIAEDVWTLEKHEERLSTPDGYRPEACPRCSEERIHVHDHLERKPLGLDTVVVGIVRYICANPDCGATWRILPAFLARHLWWTWLAVARAVMSEQPAASTQKPAPTSPARDELLAVEPVSPNATSPPVAERFVAGEGAEVEGTEACVPPDTADGAAPGYAGNRVPERTRLRWRARLASSARQLVVLLASRGSADLRTLAEGLGLLATRRELVVAYARTFAVDVETRGACIAATVHRLERGIRLM